MTTRAKFELKRSGVGLEAVLKGLLELDKSYVKAGVLGKSGEHESGEKLTNAQLALIHEFGAPERNIPARPFVMPAFAKGRAEYRGALHKLLGEAVREVAEGGHPRSFRQMLGLIGSKMAADMKAFVVGREVQPQLDPAGATYRRKMKKGKWNKGNKGTPAALIDTGRLVGSITYEVVSGD